MRTRPLLLLILLLAPACRGRATAPGPRPGYTAAADYAMARRGDAVLVVEGDRVVFEAYARGYDPAEPHRLASGTKSFACVLLAAAVEDGLLRLDEPVAGTIDAWADGGWRSRITVRHLLSLTSGLPAGSFALTGARAADGAAAALALPVLTEPGTAFRYGPANFWVFSELLRRKLGGEGVVDYLRRRVLRPIGVLDDRWRTDEQGAPDLAGGAFLTAAEWVGFGRLVRDGGTFEGRRVLPAAALAACLEPGPVAPAYGLAWWLRPDADVQSGGGGAAPPEAGFFMAAGAGNQRLYVLPASDRVVVRFGSADRRWSDDAFLRLLPPPAP